MLLVGTQAIEVSLDIDYDVIFTEPAPLDDLLQRFGRVNRHQVNGQFREPCDCIVFSERNETDKFIYKNKEIINRTLDALREMESNNEGIISEMDLQKYIDQVYPSWDLKDKENFDRIYFHLKNDVLEKLSPFIYDSHREDEFEKQFDGVKVLPIRFLVEYKQLLEENKFIKAESLKVSITKQRFASLINNMGVQREVSAYQLLQKESIKEQYYYIIERKYDSELGLQIEKMEDTNISERANVF